jgi:hypothetical protein
MKSFVAVVLAGGVVCSIGSLAMAGRAAALEYCPAKVVEAANRHALPTASFKKIVRVHPKATYDEVGGGSCYPYVWGEKAPKTKTGAYLTAAGKTFWLPR